MNIDEIVNELLRYDFYENLRGDVADSKYQGSEWVKVKELIPEDSTEKWNQLSEKLYVFAQLCTPSELESIIKKCPGGYVRMNLRTIWRERFNK